jgi:hypothetical protein
MLIGRKPNRRKSAALCYRTIAPNPEQPAKNAATPVLVLLEQSSSFTI